MVASAQVPGVALEAGFRQQLKQGHPRPADIAPVGVVLSLLPGPADASLFLFRFLLFLLPDEALGDRHGAGVPRVSLGDGQCEIPGHELVEILDGIIGKAFPSRQSSVDR